jgi:hypothetical protein
MRTELGSVVGTINTVTYTYSVREPRSDRERYMRAAPMDLYPPNQNRFTQGMREAERTNIMETRCT